VAENARRGQHVEAGEFRQLLSIVNAKKGNRTHIDLTPGSRSNGLRIDIASAAMYKAAMYTGVRVR
jgi:PadR family transcriptional regulator PadR